MSASDAAQMHRGGFCFRSKGIFMDTKELIALGTKTAKKKLYSAVRTVNRIVDEIK